MNEASCSSINVDDPFYKAAKMVFDNWTAFQLALTHSFAGSNTKETAEWFVNSTYQWILDNPDLEIFELEEFLFDTMNNEFNSILDDNSDSQVAKLLLKYNELYRLGKLNELKDELEKRYPSNKTLQTNAQISVKVKQNQEEVFFVYYIDDILSSSDEEDGSGSEDDGEDAMDQDGPKNKPPALSKEDTDNFEKMEEGWTLITKTGKHLTK